MVFRQSRRVDAGDSALILILRRSNPARGLFRRTACRDPGPIVSCFAAAETGEFISAPPQPVPAVNPHTGRATLQRALYCPQCRRWHVVPPPDVLNGPPAGYPCPQHKIAMQEQGPLPD